MGPEAFWRPETGFFPYLDLFFFVVFTLEIEKRGARMGFEPETSGFGGRHRAQQTNWAVIGRVGPWSVILIG